MAQTDGSVSTSKAAGAVSASAGILGEVAAFGVSALGLGDPGTRLKPLASFGTSLLRVNRGVIVKGHRKTPPKPLQLFEAEYCRSTGTSASSR